MRARSLSISICLLVLLLGVRSARAQQPDSSDAGSPIRGWHLAFLGGVLTPMGPMAETHQQGLAASGRLGWTSGVGLGMDLVVDYSPLPRLSSDGPDRYDTHFLAAGLMPRFTLGNQTFRMWLGGGGGMTYERTLHTRNQARQEVIRARAPSAMGAAGVELHFLSGGGLAAVASYVRTYGDTSYELLTVVGGLVIDF